jgi:hypothetical protein
VFSVCDQVEEDEVGGACGPVGGRGMYVDDRCHQRLYRVALVRTDVAENIASIIKVRRTLSSEMLSRRYQLKMSSGTLYRVALFRTDVSETIRSLKRRFETVIHGTKSQKTSLIILLQYSEILRVIGFHICDIVESLFISLSA